MKKDVKVRVLFKPGKSKKACPLVPLLGELIETERMELAVQSIMAENLFHLHDKSQNRSVALMSGLIQNRCEKGWIWIKGTLGKGPHKGATHYWLECDGWAIETTEMPGSVLTQPHTILIMDAKAYRKEMKLKAVTTRKAKQVNQWLSKQKKKKKNALQSPSAPVRPQMPTTPTLKTEAPKTEKSPKVKEAMPAEVKEAPASNEPDVDALAVELAALGAEDKAAFKKKLMEIMGTLKASGLTQTKVATAFLKAQVPTRSGRGSWNPRMVGDIFKLV
ncbi:MAG: hypothetical protein MI742_00160 [Desulfobacterales bacterium]|nr:hypothetical protein [Desulfobacterales bacterium]